MEDVRVGVGHRPAGGIVVLIERAADVQRDQAELAWQAAVSHEVIVKLIAATTTRICLRAAAWRLR
jgi:hypothetical protein